MRRVGAGSDALDAFMKAFEAQALLAAGKPRAAQATLDPVVPLFGPELDTTISLGIPTLVGTLAVHSAVGDVRAPDEARRLEAMLARAEELGSVPLAFRARLALGQYEAATGRGRARLAALARDARAKGF